jgi:tetratricopeptide (TPR) repeat protein
MFKLFQNIIRGKSSESIDAKRNSQESLSFDSSNSLSHDALTTSTKKADIFWQQGNLQEALKIYDRAIKESPNSAEVKEQLWCHLKQQDSVAQAYQRLAETLKKQGKNEEAAICYRQAIVIQAVTKEAKEKYKNTSFSGLTTQAKIAHLTDDAFTFQGAIKNSAALMHQPNLLQIELPGEYTPQTSATFQKRLDSRKIATVEWEAAHTFMQRALACCDREEWLEVADACQQATRIMPDMAEAYKIWGNALQRMNRTAEAMECYSKAVEIQPDLAKVYTGIAQLYAKERKWQQAIEYYQKAIIIKPELSSAYRSLAHVWEQSGEVEKAQVCYQRARELEATQPALSETKNNSESTPETIVNSEQTAEIVDSSITTYRQLGQDSEKQNLWHEAAVYYRKALELNLSQNQNITLPKDRQLNKTTQLARIRKIQQLIKNKEHNQIAPIEDSTFINSPDNIGRVFPSENSLDRSIEYHQRKAKLQPNSAQIQIDLGSLYEKKEQWDLAVTHYSKAVRINPTEAQAHLKLAKALAKEGDRDGYIEHMYLAYNIDPSLGSADDHFMLGENLRKEGNRNRAIFCYEQAIELQPHFTEAYQSLGRVLEETGKQNKALNCYKTAIRHNPQNADFYLRLGKLLEKQNSWDDAVTAYRQVLELQPKNFDASQKLNHALLEKLKQDLAAKARK